MSNLWWLQQGGVQ